MRKSMKALLSALGPIALQWGRTFADAEIEQSTAGIGQINYFNGAAPLQMRKCWEYRSRAFVAGVTSMGPHLCRCGNCSAIFLFCDQHLHFNGAAPLQMRKSGLPRPSTRAISRTSMGPHLCRCGNSKTSKGSRLCVSYFNGAAPLQMRKFRID